MVREIIARMSDDEKKRLKDLWESETPESSFRVTIFFPEHSNIDPINIHSPCLPHIGDILYLHSMHRPLDDRFTWKNYKWTVTGVDWSLNIYTDPKDLLLGKKHQVHVQIRVKNSRNRFQILKEKYYWPIYRYYLNWSTKCKQMCFKYV